MLNVDLIWTWKDSQNLGEWRMGEDVTEEDKTLWPIMRRLALPEEL